MISRNRTLAELPPLTAAACILCVIIFGMINSQGMGSDLTRWGLYPERAIYEGRWWPLITHAFVHKNTMHLVFNLSWLWALGGAFERTFGSLRWLLFVLLSAFVSSGIQLLSGSDGIGMSGVIYALFGFGWLVRTRYPEFARSLPPNTVQWFLGWGVLCIFLTYANILNVGNFAHLGGLLFGAALGAMVDWPKWRIPAAIGFVVLSGLSVVPIFWNPLSTSWLGVQAEKAFDRKDWPTAIHFYERALARASDESTEKWALINLVRIYRFREDTANFKRVADQLRQLDPSEADKELGGE